MEITAEIAEAHRDLSAVARRFLDFVQRAPDGRRRLRKEDAIPLWVARYMFPLQAWPIFLDTAKRAEVEAVAIRTAELIKSLFERVFENRPGRVAEFYGLGHEYLATLLLAPPNGLAGALMRGDFIQSAGGLKCLEVNSGNIGGWNIRFGAESARQSATVARFLAAEGIEPFHRDPFRELFSHVVDESRAMPWCRDGTVNVAIVIPDPGGTRSDDSLRELNRVYSQVLAQRGDTTGQVVFCSYPASPVARSGGLYHQNTRIHAVIEQTSTSTPDHVFRAFKSETVGLYDGPLSHLLSDKRNLALLSEQEESDRFDAAERSWIRAHIPWTRVVVDGETTFQGERVRLIDLVLAHRERFVLKKGFGASGEGVLVGRHAPVAAWETGLRAAAGTRGWIVQEHVESRPYLCQCGEDGAAVHDIIWGMYAFGRRYGGGFLRMLPKGSGDGIINSRRGATEGFIFEV